MWRLWEKGWGFASWLWWMRDALPRWIAFRLPRRVVLWAFIRVHAASDRSPGDYRAAYDYWEALDIRPSRLTRLCAWLNQRKYEKWLRAQAVKD